jgi:chromosome segregation ATPase
VEGEAAGRWLDVNSAAEELGVSTDAVRKRISRGSLRSDRKDGAVRVWLDDGGTEAGREAQVDGGALVEVLREQAEYLRKQLTEEREARRRADTIIAQLARANEEQARTIRELEAPQEEASEAAETVEEEPNRAEPRSAAEEANDELGAERARREMAESTLREGMAEERRRREAAERERDELRRELHARGRQQEAYETAEDEQGKGQPQFASSGPQGGAQPRPWWRRIIGR